MSLKPDPIPPIPEETARIAHAAFPHGSVFMQIRDALGPLFADEDFRDLFPTQGQPAASAWRLAFVTVMQFMENLTDRQAADAVRSRLDWKYSLSLELSDAGWDHTVLSEFRTRLVVHAAEERLLQTVLDLCKERGWLKVRGKQRTDSTHVLAKVRALNRLECVGQTMGHVLNVLALVAPEWIQAHADPAWVQRYAHRIEEYRLPKGTDERLQLANSIGADGWTLLYLVADDTTPQWLRELPALRTLRHIWDQQYDPLEAGGKWRQEAASYLIRSPYDLDARAGHKRSTFWIGYKAHFTETCDDASPHIITQVTTTTGADTDAHTLPAIHATLAQRSLLPALHEVDAGYVDAQVLVTSHDEYAVDVVGPPGNDHRWQAHEQTGYALADFRIDWHQQQAQCPQGQFSSSWSVAQAREQDVIKIKFAYTTCGPCLARTHCTVAGRRTLTVRPQAKFLALEAARRRTTTDEFKQLYHQRAGIEGTHAQAVRRCGLRRSRYIG
jgi:transposase